MINVMLISYDLPPISLWGVARHVNRLAQLLALRDNIHITMISRSANLLNELVDITSSKPSDCLIESELLSYESYIDFEYLQSWNYLLAKKVISETKYSPQIVHNHNWMTFPAAKKIARHFGAKLLSTIHFLQKQYTIAYNTLPIDSEEIIDLENDILKSSDGIILFGKNHLQFVLDNYKCNPNKIKILPHGITLPQDYFPKTSKHPDKEKVKVLFVGRLVLEKGITVLIETIERLCNEYSNIELHIAGKGPINRFDNYSFIKYHGFLEESELITLYKDADIFCLPSYTETFGLVSVEAAAYGLPLVLSRSKNVEKLFCDNEALFVDIGFNNNNWIINKDQLYYNIKKLVSSKSARSHYSKKARMASLRYDENQMMKDLMLHYENL